MKRLGRQSELPLPAASRCSSSFCVQSVVARCVRWSACVALTLGALSGEVFADDAPSGDGAATKEGPAAVQKGDDEKAIDVPSHKIRFYIESDWKVQQAEGIYFINSSDSKLMMVVVTLEDPHELPEALKALDELIPVTGARFGAPKVGGHNGIPSEIMYGSGTMQPSGQTIDLMSVTMNVGGKAVLTMFYVQRSALETHLPKVKRVLETFALQMSSEELRGLQEKLDAGRKATPSP